MTQFIAPALCRLTANNVFNHFNFLNVDPAVEDAGLSNFNQGFANPALTPTTADRVSSGFGCASAADATTARISHRKRMSLSFLPTR